MSGFGAEFRKMRDGGGAPKLNETAVKESEAEAAQKDAEVKNVESDADAEVFAQPFKHGQSALEAEAEVEEQKEPELKVPPKVPPPKEQKKIKIGGKEFDSIEEAERFAADQLAEAEKLNAYNKGKEDATKKPEPTKQEVKKAKLLADKIFEDPEAAMEEILKLAEEIAERKAEERDNKKTAAQQEAERIQQETDNFYKNHADLVDYQAEVDMVVWKNYAQLSQLPKDKIASETARLAREYVASMKDRLLPKQALPSKAAQTGSSNGGGPTTTTEKKTTDKSVSFSQQVLSTNRRNAAQADT